MEDDESEEEELEGEGIRGGGNRGGGGIGGGGGGIRNPNFHLEELYAIGMRDGHDFVHAYTYSL